MPLADYMRLALTHPQYGYYITHDPIGAAGDFITAPEISQMFGELIGVWMVAVWRQMGSPENVRVIELGPGHGTLIIDALRAAKIAKDFQTAIVLHLVEISPRLKEQQRRRLEPLDMPVLWHTTLADVPAGPNIIVANEFIDALPVHQAIKTGRRLARARRQRHPGGDLALSAARDPLSHFDATVPRQLRNSPAGSIYEWRPDSIALEIGRRVRNEGAALIVDYGHAQQGLGDSLQAVAGHSFSDPLRAPGQADLTAHVDFMALAQSAEIIGARIHGPVSQREFLVRLGIEQRAATLKARAPGDKGDEIDQALARLTAGGPDGMGDLFKVLAVTDPKLGPLPGFEA